MVVVGGEVEWCQAQHGVHHLSLSHDVTPTGRYSGTCVIPFLSHPSSQCHCTSCLDPGFFDRYLGSYTLQGQEAASFTQAHPCVITSFSLPRLLILLEYVLFGFPSHTMLIYEHSRGKASPARAVPLLPGSYSFGQFPPISASSKIEGKLGASHVG